MLCDPLTAPPYSPALQLAQKAAAANAELFLHGIRQLTDKELAAELKNYGFDGPVVATTRAVYERKLATFRAEVSGVCVPYSPAFW